MICIRSSGPELFGLQGQHGGTVMCYTSTSCSLVYLTYISKNGSQSTAVIQIEISQQLSDELS